MTLYDCRCALVHNMQSAKTKQYLVNLDIPGFQLDYIPTFFSYLEICRYLML